MGNCVGIGNNETTDSNLPKKQGKATLKMIVNTFSRQSLLKNVQNPNNLSNKLISQIIRKTKHQIKNINIIFRASQHKFLASQFHQYCSDKSNTILLAYTTNNKIFGGFTSCSWKKDQCIAYEIDDKFQSFLFNFQNGEIKIYDLKKNSKDHAIMNDDQLGPIYGDGHDLHISDQSDKKQSWSNLGKSYQCIHKFGSVKANASLCQQQKFKLKEYEIWQVQF